MKLRSLFFFIGVLILGFLVLKSDLAEKVKVNSSIDAGEVTARSLVLPDMIVAAPEQLFIRAVGGKKALRFSTTFNNQGQGALEIIGHTDKSRKTTFASQYIYETGGPGEYRDIGTFEWHEAHNHWHVSDYVRYQLIKVSDMSPVEVLTETQKMSFCIWDEFKQKTDLPGASPTRVYTSNCGRNTQGMSVGWSDTYKANVEGQEMDITKVPDGIYIFRSIVNPDRKILESNFDNNTTDAYIEIKGNVLTRKSTL